jgi:hypothetical protein
MCVLTTEILRIKYLYTGILTQTVKYKISREMQLRVVSVPDNRFVKIALSACLELAIDTWSGRTLAVGVRD